HRLFRPLKYVVLISIPVWLYASAVTIWGAASVEQKSIMFCNPPLALNGAVNRFWLYSNLAIIVIVVVLHFLVWLILKKKGILHHPSVTSLRESGVAFDFCAASAVSLVLVHSSGRDRTVRRFSVQVFFGLLCYSQSYYILLWRSPEYSTAFKEQLRIMFRTALDDTTPKAKDFTPTEGNRQSGTSTNNV
ncbi:hypothetical protein ANCDUO_14072, partial [Ancylostoma duodenale]